MNVEQNSKLSAFPVVETFEAQRVDIGLTKREYFACQALQGLLSNHSLANMYGSLSDNALAQYSVKMADELLKELSE